MKSQAVFETQKLFDGFFANVCEEYTKDTGVKLDSSVLKRAFESCIVETSQELRTMLCGLASKEEDSKDVLSIFEDSSFLNMRQYDPTPNKKKRSYEWRKKRTEQKRASSKEIHIEPATEQEILEVVEKEIVIAVENVVEDVVLDLSESVVKELVVSDETDLTDNISVFFEKSQKRDELVLKSKRWKKHVQDGREVCVMQKEDNKAAFCIGLLDKRQEDEQLIKLSSTCGASIAWPKNEVKDILDVYFSLRASAKHTSKSGKCFKLIPKGEQYELLKVYVTSIPEGEMTKFIPKDAKYAYAALLETKDKRTMSYMTKEVVKMCKKELKRHRIGLLSKDLCVKLGIELPVEY